MAGYESHSSLEDTIFIEGDSLDALEAMLHTEQLPEMRLAIEAAPEESADHVYIPEPLAAPEPDAALKRALQDQADAESMIFTPPAHDMPFTGESMRLVRDATAATDWAKVLTGFAAKDPEHYKNLVTRDVVRRGMSPEKVVSICINNSDIELSEDRRAALQKYMLKHYEEFFPKPVRPLPSPEQLAAHPEKVIGPKPTPLPAEQTVIESRGKYVPKHAGPRLPLHRELRDILPSLPRQVASPLEEAVMEVAHTAPAIEPTRILRRAERAAFNGRVVVEFVKGGPEVGPTQPGKYEGLAKIFHLDEFNRPVSLTVMAGVIASGIVVPSGVAQADVTRHDVDFVPQSSNAPSHNVYFGQPEAPVTDIDNSPAVDKVAAHAAFDTPAHRQDERMLELLDYALMFPKPVTAATTLGAAETPQTTVNTPGGYEMALADIMPTVQDFYLNNGRTSADPQRAARAQLVEDMITILQVQQHAGEIDTVKADMVRSDLVALVAGAYDPSEYVHYADAKELSDKSGEFNRLYEMFVGGAMVNDPGEVMTPHQHKALLRILSHAADQLLPEPTKAEFVQTASQWEQEAIQQSQAQQTEQAEAPAQNNDAAAPVAAPETAAPAPAHTGKAHEHHLTKAEQHERKLKALTSVVKHYMDLRHSAHASTWHGKPSELAEMVLHASEKHDVPANLLLALLYRESGFNPNAQSPAGALGMGQIMPATAEGNNIDDPTDPYQAVMGAAKILSGHLHHAKRMVDNGEWHGKVNDLALASYNAGAGAVDHYKAVPPYKETSDYVEIIGGISKKMDKLNNAALPPVAPAEQTPAPAQPQDSPATPPTDNPAPATPPAPVTPSDSTPVVTPPADPAPAQPPAQDNQGQAKADQDKGHENDEKKDDKSDAKKYRDGDGNETDSGVPLPDTIRGHVYYSQWDDRWADKNYGTSDMKGSACEPTTMAMVISNLTGKKVLPTEVAKFNLRNHLRVPYSGTSHAAVGENGDEYGVSVDDVNPNNREKINQALNDGAYIVVVGRDGDLSTPATSAGHFYAISGKDGGYEILDPNSLSKSQHEGWSYDDVFGPVYEAWIVYK